MFLTACNRAAYEAPSATYSDPLAAYRFGCTPLDSLTVAAHLPELEATFGEKIDCPDEYRDKLLAALSFYPQLWNIRIKVVQKTLPTSMQVRPANFAFARNGRGYRIYVDDTRTDKVTDFRRASYSAQIGCFIHELGHMTHYEKRSNVRLLADGTGYVTSQKFRTHYEAIADQNAIAYGGGYYTYQFSNFIFERAGISKAYRKFKKANYYTNHEILALHNAARKERGMREPCPALD